MNAYNPHHVETPVYFRAGVKVLVTDADDNLLILKRSDKSSTAGQWELPGGGVDTGEHPFQAAVREIKEETGLEVRSGDLRLLTAASVSTKNGDAIIILGYAARVDASDKIDLSWEHDDYRWVGRDEVGGYSLPGFHRYLVDTFHAM